MKKYNIVLAEPQATKFKEWLKKNGINYEPSSYGECIYFSIRATEYKACAINTELERLYNKQYIARVTDER